jgi:hypothetical protein
LYVIPATSFQFSTAISDRCNATIGQGTLQPLGFNSQRPFLTAATTAPPVIDACALVFQFSTAISDRCNDRLTVAEPRFGVVSILNGHF